VRLEVFAEKTRPQRLKPEIKEGPSIDRSGEPLRHPKAGIKLKGLLKKLGKAGITRSV
jgi:hypothetical protein